MHHHNHTPQHGESNQHQAPKWLLPVLLVAQLMVILDITAVNIALPHIAADLNMADFVERGTTRGLDTTGCDGAVVLPPFPLTDRARRSY